MGTWVQPMITVRVFTAYNAMNVHVCRTTVIIKWNQWDIWSQFALEYIRCDSMYSSRIMSV